LTTGVRWPEEIHFRRATISDAEELARGVIEGVEDYPSFAPAAWTAPSFEEEVGHLRESLADERVWCLVAESDGEIVGQITLLAAVDGPHPVADPTLAHISGLFVRRDFWGTGVAHDLNAAAVEKALEHGFKELRLFVAAGQARARRFYEREGWFAVGDEFDDSAPGLTMVEYRCKPRDR
jgi:GNAT superfamily N-acetyltransferase